jgi:phosphoserine phosphatase
MPLRLAIFDLDGTLKRERDPYVCLHRRLGTWEAAQAFHARALAGELDYDEWLRLDVELWKGVSRARMEALFRENPYLPGAQDTVRTLKRAGIRVALVSTGLRLHAEQVQQDLGLDRIIANEMLFENGRATGQARCHVPEAGKGQIVAQLQAEFGVGPGDCLAVGDGISDADMFALVRVGVAVNPSSDRVRAAAGLVLEEPDLRPLLPLLRQTLPGWMPPHLLAAHHNTPHCNSPHLLAADRNPPYCRNCP